MITPVKDKLNKDVTYSNCKLCTENVSYKAFIKLVFIDQTENLGRKR